MAFEKLAPHIDFIEKGLADGKSPRAIAKELGEPSLFQTIYRYKSKCFDLNSAATGAWTEERQKNHDTRFNEGKAKIIDSLELLNLVKLRADQLLSLEIGQNVLGKDGPAPLSPGYAVYLWGPAAKMAIDAIKQEQEISGDDPGSKAADSLIELLHGEF